LIIKLALVGVSFHLTRLRSGGGLETSGQLYAKDCDILKFNALNSLNNNGISTDPIAFEQMRYLTQSKCILIKIVLRLRLINDINW